MDMPVQTFTPDNKIKPIGPYSHIACAGPFITISGTPAVHPDTGEMVGTDAYSQARQILMNFQQFLKHVDADLNDVMHIKVFLKHKADFAEMNRAYSEFFNTHLPARTVIVVADLPKDGALMTMNLNAVKL